MSSDVRVSLGDLEAALYWVSADGALENRALVSKTSGAIYYSSADGEIDEELPEDIEDATAYWSVPHKNDLELGRALVLSYVTEAMPEDYGLVRQYFQRRGAYSQFKALLSRRGHLESWHEYENRAVLRALTEWAAECGFQAVRGLRTPTGA